MGSQIYEETDGRQGLIVRFVYVDFYSVISSPVIRLLSYPLSHMGNRGGEETPSQIYVLLSGR